MSERRDLVEHLRFYAELGVDGVSRDASWRRRASGPSGAGAVLGGAPPLAAAAESSAPARAGEDVALLTEGSAGMATTPVLAEGEAGARLRALRLHIGDCARCKLHAQGRTQVVFGVGDPLARLMFVGEGPGHDEDLQGEPFVGRAGQLLTKMIEAIELVRSQVYIANVVKCRPPGNRNPEPDEIATCEPFLFEQIAIVRPKVIVALGKFAAQTLLRSTAPISKLRGQVYEYRGATLIPTFHPAFLLRSPDYKREAWEDLKKARALLSDA